MQHAIILGLLVFGPPSPPAATLESGAPVVLAQSGETDLLMHPSRETEGAARLGGTEIVNPPHESFGMMQKPTNPSELDIRKGPTGEPTVSGPEAKANAAEVHQQRAAAAQESQVTRQQAADDAANAQAAGVQAAISSAATSRAAAEAPPPADQPSTPSTAPVIPDQGPDQSGPPDASPPAAPEPVDPPDR